MLRLVGTSLATQESVPAAFAVLAASPDDPWLACRLAASLGGDCDTIAAMAGAVGGACHGAKAFPGGARRTVDRGERPAAWTRSPRACSRCGPRPAAPGALWPGSGGPVTRFGRLLHLGNVVVDVVLNVGGDSPTAAATCWPRPPR